MIETKKEQERVILLGVSLPDEKNFEMSMLELEQLAQTAGGLVIERHFQKRERYDTSTFIGKGKLEEIKQIIDAQEIDTVIVNNRLTPRQNINLETKLGVKVIDRMQLILDIFAMRARSHEGKLQVQLAQLKYLLPRLVGQGIMLSRQAGGIGSRGPGESQLELNRRSIRNQITDIERKLKTVSKNRQTIREKRVRSTSFDIGLIGYTNAGKSTIMNLLTENNHYEADELFATLDATTKQIYLKDRFQATLTDTVGFIQDLPTELVAAFKSTLEESRQVDLLLHVIDASDPNYLEQETIVLELLKELDMANIPRLAIYNKMDLVDNFVPNLHPSVMVCAKSAKAAQTIRSVIISEIKKHFQPFELTISLEQNHQIFELSQLALIDEISLAEDKQQIKGYISEKNKWKIEALYHGLS
ncbi:GTPase HflX [Streptococcus pacificus]|uniref:GTPase HflX n=1 Tax=Streptococcus pacificus TaxID=2740577 RepID=A0ABS0ZHW8_9STRE|nr:GTPase HflX [Streptococcus pacificus]MBJ8325453.1 GTPase HflX [Streptococcus pacificus]